MARTRTIETGWTHPETEDDYRVTLEFEPGSPGGRDEPPTGPEIAVVKVVEDRKGGVERPDLIAMVEAELDGRFGDEATEEIGEYEEDARASALEARGDAAREERMLGGRP